MDKNSQQSMHSKASTLRKPSKYSNAESSPLKQDSNSMVQSLKGPKTEKGSSKPSDIQAITSPTVIVDNNAIDQAFEQEGFRRVVYNQNLADYSKSKDESSFQTAGADEAVLYHINISESQKGSLISQQFKQEDMDSNIEMNQSQENETAINGIKSMKNNSIQDQGRNNLIQESHQYQVMNKSKSIDKNSLIKAISKKKLNSDLEESEHEQNQTFQASNQESQHSNKPFDLSVHTNNLQSSMMIQTKREDDQGLEQRSLKKDKQITDSAIDIHLVQRSPQNSTQALDTVKMINMYKPSSNPNFNLSDQKSPEFFNNNLTKSNETSKSQQQKYKIQPQKQFIKEEPISKPKLLKKNHSKLKEQQNPNIEKVFKKAEGEVQISKKRKLREEVRNNQDVRVRKTSVPRNLVQQGKPQRKNSETGKSNVKIGGQKIEEVYHVKLQKDCKISQDKSVKEQKPWRQKAKLVKKKPHVQNNQIDKEIQIRNSRNNSQESSKDIVVQEENSLQRKVSKLAKKLEQTDSSAYSSTRQLQTPAPEMYAPPPLPIYADIGMKFDLEATFWNETDQNVKANFRKQRKLKKSQPSNEVESYIRDSKIMEILQNDVWNVLLLQLAKEEVQKDYEKLREQDCDSSVQFQSSTKANSYRRAQLNLYMNQNINVDIQDVQSGQFQQKSHYYKNENQIQEVDDQTRQKKNKRRFREKIRPFSTAKLIKSSNSNAAKAQRQNLIRNPSLTENFLENFVQRMEKNRSVSRMSHGLKRSVQIHKKAQGKIKDLVNLDFSYLDKEDLKMASAKHISVQNNFDGHIYGIQGQSKNETLAQLRNYQQQRRYLQSTAAESLKVQPNVRVASPFDFQSEPIIGTQKHRCKKQHIEQEALQNLEVHSEFLKCRADIPKRIQNMKIISQLQRVESPDSLNGSKSPYRVCCDSPRILEAQPNVFSKFQIMQQRESVSRLSQKRQSVDKHQAAQMLIQQNQIEISKKRSSLGRRKQRLEKLSFLSTAKQGCSKHSHGNEPPTVAKIRKQEYLSNIQSPLQPQSSQNPQSQETNYSKEPNVQSNIVLNSNIDSIAQVTQIDMHGNINVQQLSDSEQRNQYKSRNQNISPVTSNFSNTQNNSRSASNQSRTRHSNQAMQMNRSKTNKSKQSSVRDRELSYHVKSNDAKESRTPTAVGSVPQSQRFENFAQQAELQLNIARNKQNQQLSESIMYIGEQVNIGDETHESKYVENILNVGQQAISSPKVNSADESSYFLSNYDDKGESQYNKSDNLSGSVSRQMHRKQMLSKARGSVPGLANCASNLSISMNSVSAQSFMNRSNYGKQSQEKLKTHNSLNKLKITKTSGANGLESNKAKSKDHSSNSNKKGKFLSPLNSSKRSKLKHDESDLNRSLTLQEQSMLQIHQQAIGDGDIISVPSHLVNQNRIQFEQINNQSDLKMPIRRQLTNISQRGSENASSQENYGITTGQKDIQKQNAQLVKDSSRQQIDSVNQQFIINTNESKKEMYGQEQSYPSQQNHSTSNEHSRANLQMIENMEQITKIIHLPQGKQMLNRTEGDPVHYSHNTSGQYTFNEQKNQRKNFQDYVPTDSQFNSQVFLKVDEKSISSEQDDRDTNQEKLSSSQLMQSNQQQTETYIDRSLSQQHQSSILRQITSNTNVIQEAAVGTQHIIYGYSQFHEKQSEKTMHKAIDEFVFDQNQDEIKNVSMAKDSIAEVVINQSDDMFEQASNIEMDLVQPKLMARNSVPVNRYHPRNSNILVTGPRNLDNGSSQLGISKQKSMVNPDKKSDLRKRKPVTTKNTNKQMFGDKNKLDIPSNFSSQKANSPQGHQGHVNISHNEIKDSGSNSKDQGSIENFVRKRSNSSKQKRSIQSKQVSFSEKRSFDRSKEVSTSKNEEAHNQSRQEKTSDKLKIYFSKQDDGQSNESSDSKMENLQVELTPSMKMHPADLNLRQGPLREQYSKNAIDAQKLKMQRKMKNKKIELLMK